MTASIPATAEACSIEIFRRHIPGDVKISYYVSATQPTTDVPYPDPLDIISWDQTVYVIVDVVLGDPVRRFLCGNLCVDIDIDTCGPAPDKQFPEQVIQLDPCGNGHHTIPFELPAGTFEPAPGFPSRCGRVYRICVTVGSFDLCDPPKPGLIWGHCDALDIAVHAPVPA